MGKFAKGYKGGGGMAFGIGPADSMDEYSSFAADIDATTRNGATAATKQDLIPRGFMVSDAGATTKKIALLMADGIQATYDVTNLVGVLVPANFRTIIGTTTTIARVLVMY